MRPQRHQPTRLHHPWDSPGKNNGVDFHFLLQCMKVKSEVKLLSRVWLFATPWTAAYQAPPFMGFSRWEYWSELPLSSLVKRLPHTSKSFNMRHLLVGKHFHVYQKVCLQTRWMDKEVVVHIYNGILLTHKKEWIWFNSVEVDEPRDCCTEWSMSEALKDAYYHLSDS